MLLLLCCTATLLACACSDNDPPVSDLTIMTSAMNFTSEPADQTVLIRTDGNWRATANPWCIVSPASGGAGTSEVTISVEENTGDNQRQGQVLFTAGNLSHTITIVQEGKGFVPSDNEGMVSDAPTLASKMILGWNLGNSLEACSATSASETMWGNARTTQRLIDSIKAAGFNTIRIPCAWNGYIENETTFKIKDSWLQRVKEVVDYCMNNKMYVILNIHWDGGWLEENPYYAKQEAINKKQKALWEQIATHFRDYDEHLLFAGTNEVHANYSEPSNENIEVQLSFNQTFVDAVRSTGGKNAYRNLVVQSYNTNIEYAIKYLKMPSDKVRLRLFAEVHYYDPFDFTIQSTPGFKTQWGKPFAGGDVSSYGQEDWVDECFGKMKRNFIDKGIPVILGEYGASLRSALIDGREEHIAARNYYLNYVTKSAKANGLIPCYWDNGSTGNNASGLFNRATGNQVHPDAIQAIVSGI